VIQSQYMEALSTFLPIILITKKRIPFFALRGILKSILSAIKMKKTPFFFVCITLFCACSLQAQNSPSFFFKGNVPLGKGELLYQNSNIGYNHLFYAPHDLVTVGLGAALFSWVSKLPSAVVSAAVRLPLRAARMGLRVGGYYQFAKSYNKNYDDSRYYNYWVSIDYKASKSIVSLQGGVVFFNYWSYMSAGYGLLGTRFEFIESNFVGGNSPYVTLQYSIQANKRAKILSEFSYTYVTPEEADLLSIGLRCAGNSTEQALSLGSVAFLSARRIMAYQIWL
jgi:hypothetical protein